jgi:23S rRNA pseudouridine1911/1915/1917 synthase
MELEPGRIIFQNKACIVVNKLPGEAVEGAGEGMSNLGAALKTYLGLKIPPNGSAPGPSAVHRLDVPVSGCCLFALTHPALAFLGSAFSQGVCGKKYWAILELPHPQIRLADDGELVHWIKKVPGNKSIVYDKEGKERKKAVLRYKITGRGENYLFMEIELATGRHHQIRAQLSKLGLHIKGDLKYGARRSEKGGGIRLHAASLSFPNPLDREETITVSALPPRMDALWQAMCSFQPL